VNEGPSLLPVLVVSGVALGTVISWQAQWAVARLLFVRRPFPGDVRAYAPVIAAALRGESHGDGRGVRDALFALQPLMRWPYSWRLRDAAVDLREGASLIETLDRHRLLPRECVEVGRAAERSGARALGDWFASLAGPEPEARPQPVYGWSALPSAVLIVAVIRFFIAFIVPKFEMIFRDLGLELGRGMETTIAVARFLAHWETLWWIALFVLSLVAMRLWSLAWWAPLRRIQRGELLLAGTAAGKDEPTLAEELAASFARPPSALRRAGADGDFPGLCRACGLSASTPSELAVAVMRARERRLRLVARLRLAAAVLAPLILAVPVWWFSTLVFGVLTRLVQALTELG
jgi:hypothetical protein